MDLEARIFVAGQDTLIGAAIQRLLARQGYTNAAPPEPNLRDARAVDEFFSDFRPEYVFFAAGRSGGIAANQRYPADLMLDNMLAAAHVVSSASTHRVRKLLYLASSCSYPRECAQPMREEALLTGPLELTNEAYATAKLAGWKLCQAYREQYGADFVTAIPANSFGPGDDFSLDDSHVIAALIRRMYEAKLAGSPAVEVWGTGAPRRDFLFVDDVAEACLFVMNRYDDRPPINIGSGSDWSIAEIARTIQAVVGYAGELRFNPSRPDGMPVKRLDAARLRSLGWRPKTPLREALQRTYEWFLESRRDSPSSEKAL